MEYFTQIKVHEMSAKERFDNIPDILICTSEAVVSMYSELDLLEGVNYVRYQYNVSSVAPGSNPCAEGQDLFSIFSMINFEGGGTHVDNIAFSICSKYGTKVNGSWVPDQDYLVMYLSYAVL